MKNVKETAEKIANDDFAEIGAKVAVSEDLINDVIGTTETTSGKNKYFSFNLSIKRTDKNTRKIEILTDKIKTVRDYIGKKYGNYGVNKNVVLLTLLLFDYEKNVINKR